MCRTARTHPWQFYYCTAAEKSRVVEGSARGRGEAARISTKRNRHSLRAVHRIYWHHHRRSRKESESEFISPASLALDHVGNVLACDSFSHLRIKREHHSVPLSRTRRANFSSGWHIDYPICHQCDLRL